MNLQRFYTSPREITFSKLLKSQYELLPFGALCNLIAKMHNASKFRSIKFMDANFFYYSIYDRFIRRKPCPCVHASINFFFKKLLLRNCCMDFYRISRECSLDRG